MRKPTEVPALDGTKAARMARAERLKKARKGAGFQSAAKAVEKFGWPISAYRAHENGQNGIGPESLIQYAEAFQVDPAWLGWGSEAVQAIERDGAVLAKPGGRLPIAGIVEAGTWREPESFDTGAARVSTMPPSERFLVGQQFVLQVRGDSMDAAKPIPILPGAEVRCVTFEGAGAFLRNGQICALERRRGQLAETTLKRVVRTGSRVELRPESTNRSLQTVVLEPKEEDEDGIEIAVTGIVTGIFNPVDF